MLRLESSFLMLSITEIQCRRWDATMIVVTCICSMTAFAGQYYVERNCMFHSGCGFIIGTNMLAMWTNKMLYQYGGSEWHHLSSTPKFKEPDRIISILRAFGGTAVNGIDNSQVWACLVEGRSCPSLCNWLLLTNERRGKPQQWAWISAFMPKKGATRDSVSSGDRRHVCRCCDNIRSAV